MTPPLVLTRPAAQAQAWTVALGAWGVPTHSLPLIDTQAMPGAQPVARAQVATSDWVFFTSPAAVAALFEGGWAWPAGPRATCVGPGTAAALQAAGVPADRCLSPPDDAAQFDSEHLWPLLQTADDWRGRRMLWLCGEGGRDWLIQRLTEAGAQVSLLPVYRRTTPAVEPAVLHALLSAPALWLFSSSEAIANLARLAPSTDWSRVQALATHPRIAERAQALGMRCQVVSPQAPSVAAAWQHWAQQAAS